MDLTRVNLGCGPRMLEGYTNIDMDSIEEMEEKYANLNYDEKLHSFIESNVFELRAYIYEELDEIRADSLIEHLPFTSEKEFFINCFEMLKPGGTLRLSTPNFEEVVKIWLEAPDDWKDFIKTGPEATEKEHWFGHYTYDYTSRWGYIMATIFGHQQGDGQFHCNAYTENKLRAILECMNFENIVITKSRWKDTRDPMLEVVATKKT
jgi:predicted SAM-dependent methyltransferase